MKILETPAYFWPKDGGIESISYYLSREFVKKGNQVRIITSRLPHTKRKEQKEGITIVRCTAKTIAGDSIAPFLPFVLFRTTPDIVHVHHPHPWFLTVVSLVCYIRNIPYLIHMHGKELVLPGVSGVVASIYNRFILDRVLKHSARILSHTQKAVNQSLYLTRYKHKITYIPHGVDMEQFDWEASTGMRKQLKIKERNIILSLGVLREYKRLDILIRGLPEIIKQCPNTVLLIAGKGPEEKKLKRLAKHIDMNKHIRFIGFVPDDALLALYKIANVFILPSPTIMESFGTVVFEAIAMKVPVIVTSGAGVSEVFEKEQIGVVVKPFSSEGLAHATITILNDSKKSKQIAEKAYKTIKNKYQWKQIAKTYIKTFEEVLRDGNRTW